jgi:hypothetical protein
MDDVAVLMNFLLIHESALTTALKPHYLMHMLRFKKKVVISASCYHFTRLEVVWKVYPCWITHPSCLNNHVQRVHYVLPTVSLHLVLCWVLLSFWLINCFPVPWKLSERPSISSLLSWFLALREVTRWDVFNAAMRHHGVISTRRRIKREVGQHPINCHHLEILWGTFWSGDLQLDWRKIELFGLL